MGDALLSIDASCTKRRVGFNSSNVETRRAILQAILPMVHRTRHVINCQCFDTFVKGENVFKEMFLSHGLTAIGGPLSYTVRDRTQLQRSVHAGQLATGRRPEGRQGSPLFSTRSAMNEGPNLCGQPVSTNKNGISRTFRLCFSQGYGYVSAPVCPIYVQLRGCH